MSYVIIEKTNLIEQIVMYDNEMKPSNLNLYSLLQLEQILKNLKNANGPLKEDEYWVIK